MVVNMAAMRWRSYTEAKDDVARISEIRMEGVIGMRRSAEGQDLETPWRIFLIRKWEVGSSMPANL